MTNRSTLQLKININIFLTLLVLALPIISVADTAGYRLVFNEVEPGVSPYVTHYSITEGYLRIDDLSDTEGYVLYDVDQRRIYSVSHQDRSILVIDRHDFDAMDTKGIVITDIELEDAPKISGRSVKNYKVEYDNGSEKELCTSVQYAPDLLVQVTQVLQEYRLTVSGNQARIIDRTPAEYQTPCMLIDQVYSRAEYYAKGLPVLEWHSDGKQRLLQDFGKADFKDELFVVPEDYRQFSLN